MANEDERFFLFAIQTILHGYPRLMSELIKAEGSASGVFTGDRIRFRDLFGYQESAWLKFKNFNDWKKLEKIWNHAKASLTSIICICDESYPRMLREIVDPPLAITVRGRGELRLNIPCVGIVGSRKANSDGKRLAFEIAGSLCESGFCIVSGMAYGVDAAAHRGALDAQGNTIAVFGCGLDHIYPAEHLSLSQKISDNGLLLSEFPIGIRPYPSYFPQRNRIISGMSLGVLIVQAAHSSGSLITAKLALEQGREVFAVPGVGGSWAVAGSNGLIRDGATLVESVDDMLGIVERELEKWPDLKKSGHFEDDVGKGSTLLSFFPKRGEVTVDELIKKTGMETSKILMEITKLTLGGEILELPGRRFRIGR
ncbi:MAG: DNA-protecting protein DprA [Deltaproteobacteria bacterium]|jgi:DNA processing protein|nr:DNA-protecting protein DprA [Deltaproteobacteria bacterium]